MPLPVIADVYRCALHWRTGGAADAVNVMHLRDVSGTGSAAAAYAALNGNVTSNMWKLVSAAADVDQVTVQPLDGSTAGSVFGTGSPAKWTGQGGSDYAPAVASIVKLQTGLSGRSKRGRLFLPFVGESNQTGGIILSTDVTTAQTAWTAFLAAMVTAGYPLCVASYLHASKEDVTIAQVEGLTATQKRRMSRLR